MEVMQLLGSEQCLGQYGRVLSVTLSKAKQSFYNAFVEYQSEADAALALLSLDNFIYGGKVIRVFYGSTKYCYAFLSGAACNIPYCSYSHQFERSFTYFKENTSAINHYKIANKILRAGMAGREKRNSTQGIFPCSERTLTRIQQNGPGNDSDSSSSHGQLTAEDWQELQRQIDIYSSSQQQKSTGRKRTAIQEFLEQAQQKLLSLIFKSSAADT